MIYACIGFLGVLVGALCVYFFAPEIVVTEKQHVHETETQTDARLARQWQNLLSYTADGGDDDDADC